jgi:hypothetical protein
MLAEDPRELLGLMNVAPAGAFISLTCYWLIGCFEEQRKTYRARFASRTRNLPLTSQKTHLKWKRALYHFIMVFSERVMLTAGIGLQGKRGRSARPFGVSDLEPSSCHVEILHTLLATPEPVELRPRACGESDTPSRG